MEIGLIKRMVQWKISSACILYNNCLQSSEIKAYKDIVSTKNLSQHFQCVVKNADNFQILCLSVSTLGSLKTREWKTRDGRKVTVENRKSTRITEFNVLRRDSDRSRFGLVRKRSDFDSSDSVNRKRVCGSVCDQSEQRSWAGSVRFNMADVYMRKKRNCNCNFHV